MFTLESPETLAAGLSRMTVEPVSLEKAEALLSEDMAWLPQGEPLQCIAEDRIEDIQGAGGVTYRLHRRTIVFRREGDRLQIMVEMALLGPDGIELERRRFDELSDEARYGEEVRRRIAGSSALTG